MSSTPDGPGAGRRRKNQPPQPATRKSPSRAARAVPSREAQRRAAMVLEVLGGARLPRDAAAALGISLPTYYQLEERALRGLVAFCEPCGSSAPNAERQIAALEKELARWKRECVRYQGLVRASQRTIGLAPPQPPVKVPGKRSCARRPIVRALRAATTLRAAGDAPQQGNGLPAETTSVLQQGLTTGPSPPDTPPPATAAAGP
jgi:hypothetical protein